MGLAEELDAFARERLLVRLAQVADGAPRAYALSRRGVALAEQTLGVHPAVLDPRRSVYTLAHELAKNDLAAVLVALHRAGSLALVRWETSRTRLADAAHLVVRGALVRIPLVPDALAVVEDGEGRATALLFEVDRATVSVARMRSKYAGYLAWWRSGGPERRFGLRALRVVTLAPTNSRIDRLRDAARDAGLGRGSALFWFGRQDLVSLVSPERIFEPAWTTAAGAEHEQLVVPRSAPTADERIGAPSARDPRAAEVTTSPSLPEPTSLGTSAM